MMKKDTGIGIVKKTYEVPFYPEEEQQLSHALQMSLSKSEQEVLDWKVKTKLAEEEYMHLREKLNDINRDYRNLQVSHQVLAEENNWLHAENSRLKDEIIMLRKDIDELKTGKGYNGTLNQ